MRMICVKTRTFGLVFAANAPSSVSEVWNSCIYFGQSSPPGRGSGFSLEAEEMRSAQLTLDTGSGVEKEHLFADNDGRRGAGGFGIGPRHPGAEEHDNRTVCLLGLTA